MKEIRITLLGKPVTIMGRETIYFEETSLWVSSNYAESLVVRGVAVLTGRVK